MIRYLFTLSIILFFSNFQVVFAQKLVKGFKYLTLGQYEKAMEVFEKAESKKTELFAVNYAFSKIYSDESSQYFSPDQALLCIKAAKKYQKNYKYSEQTTKVMYDFDFTDVEVQYNYALYVVLNKVDKIETITQLFRKGVNNEYERGILEEKAFKCALTENTTISYSRFLEYYPNSKFANVAKTIYIQKWFETADNCILKSPDQKNGFRIFVTRYPENRFSKNCNGPNDYKIIRKRALLNNNYQLSPELSEIIEQSDSLNLDKDEILQYFIDNFCRAKSVVAPKENVKPEFKINNFSVRDMNIGLGAKLFVKERHGQQPRPKSTPSGMDFVLKTYGDNPYAMRDFDRGRRAIAFYYQNYFNNDVDWDYFADSLNKIDFNDSRFKAAIATLQKDFPNAFYADQANSVGNNVFMRICGAEIINNFGVSSSIFEQFEGCKVPGTDFIFKSNDLFSSFLNRKTGKYTYYFVATDRDSIVCGAYGLFPEIVKDTLMSYKLLNINSINGKFNILKSNSPGLVFFERDWAKLYYLVEQNSIWIVKRKYRRE